MDFFTMTNTPLLNFYILLLFNFNIFIFKENALYIVCFHIFASFFGRDELWQEADNSFRFFFVRLDEGCILFLQFSIT